MCEEEWVRVCRRKGKRRRRQEKSRDREILGKNVENGIQGKNRERCQRRMER